jgi:hypothetical protein
MDYGRLEGWEAKLEELGWATSRILMTEEMIGMNSPRKTTWTEDKRFTVRLIV